MSPLYLFLLSTLLSISPSPSLPLQPPLLAPIQKDHNTLQYTLTAYLKTPLQPTKLLLDLGASFSWVDCYNNYTSSTYQQIPCNSSLCSFIDSLACSNCYKPLGPTCFNDSCSLFPENPITRKVDLEDALIDSLALPTTDGSAPGQLGIISKFIFSCSKTSLLDGLAKGVTGLAALGRSNYSLQAQVSTAFSLPRYFALCLSGSRSKKDYGVAFFGSSGPYYFWPHRIDLSKSLNYTPLIVNPFTDTVITYALHPSHEYFIGLTSIKVNGKVVPLNKSLLVIDENNGYGGTKISTVVPYMVLESSIYKAFIEVFVRESSALNLTLTNAVKPFSVCYLASNVISTRVGPGVPTVDLVMQGDDVFWRIFGSNSMVRITKKGGVDVWCLGFVDGGVNPRTSIVIGGHQMEDNLLQFDLESNRLGFSSSVLLQGTTCANFNFTSKK